jgi:hypothetical protein
MSQNIFMKNAEGRWGLGLRVSGSLGFTDFDLIYRA